MTTFMFITTITSITTLNTTCPAAASASLSAPSERAWSCVKGIDRSLDLMLVLMKGLAVAEHFYGPKKS